MSVEQDALKEIEKSRESTSKLYSCLYGLVYDGKIKNVKFLEGLYSSFLKDERSSIRQVSIYALLFGLQIKNDIYKQKAIEFICDLRSSFDLRLFSLSGLSQAYANTHDLELLSVFYSLFRDEAEDGDIRATSFTGMMRVIGSSTVEIIRKNGNVIIGYEDIQLDEFVDQIREVERIISS
jgi:hypothetical protein